MVSWSVAVASKRQENRQKSMSFCKRNCDPLFVNMGGCISGIARPQTPHALSAWLTLPRRAIFVSADDSHACHRSSSKGIRQTGHNEKCGSPLRRAPCLGLSFARADFRSFLFPIFQDVIQGFVQCSFHALFHDSHDLCFKDGLLFLLLFFSVFII